MVNEGKVVATVHGIKMDQQSDAALEFYHAGVQRILATTETHKHTVASNCYIACGRCGKAIPLTTCSGCATLRPQYRRSAPPSQESQSRGLQQVSMPLCLHKQHLHLAAASMRVRAERGTRGVV